MTTLLDPGPRPSAIARTDDHPTVEVIVPAHDEEVDLRPSVRRLHTSLSGGFPFGWRITIADNASTDAAPSPVADGVRPGLPGQLGRFAVVGAVSTLAYLLLYVMLRPFVGPQAANAASLLVAALANAAANRRFTFAPRRWERALRRQAEGLGVFGLGLVVTSGSLAGLHAVTGTPSTPVELAVLVTANAVATVLRFVLVASWVFPPRRRGTRAVRPVLEEGSE